MTKSTPSTAAGPTPEPPQESSTYTAGQGARLEALDLRLSLMIQRRKTLGEYNADAADTLAIAHSLRAVIQIMRGVTE